MRCISAAALAATVAVAAGPPAEDRRPDSARIQGSWKGVYDIIDGYKVVPSDMTGRDYDIRFDGDRYIYSAGTATFRLDTTKEPRVLERTYLTGRWKGTRWDAIYRLDGDRLTLCFAEPGKPVPKKFESPRGSGIVIYVFERVRPGGK